MITDRFESVKHALDYVSAEYPETQCSTLVDEQHNAHAMKFMEYVNWEATSIQEGYKPFDLDEDVPF